MSMTVDAHPHLVAADTQRYPIAPLGGRQSEWSKGLHLTAEELLGHMEKAGVDQAAVVQASTVHGYDNSYCADSAARYPNRFVGVSCVDPLASDAPKTLAYWVEARGMRGVRLFTTGSTLPESEWLDSPATYPFWQEAKRLAIPVDVQVRFTGLAMFRRIADRFHDVPMIMDHLANPPLEDGPPYERAQALFSLAGLPNVYLKFSSNNIMEADHGRSTAHEFLERLVEHFGPRRLLWGSNFPGTRGSPQAPYRDLVDLARRAVSFLPEGDQAWLMGGTAQALFPDLRRADT